MPGLERRNSTPAKLATKKPAQNLINEAESTGQEFETSMSLQSGPVMSQKLTRSNILTMQRTVGNQAVLRMLGQRQAPTASGQIIQRKMNWKLNDLIKLQSNTAIAKNTTFKAFGKMTGDKSETDRTLTQIIDAYKSYMYDDPKSDLWYLGKMNSLCNKWFENTGRNGKKAVKLDQFHQALKLEMDVKLQPFIDKTGLAMSYLKELAAQSSDIANSPLLLLVDADTYLEDGNVGKADATLQKLKEVLGAPYDVVKGQLIRAHIGTISPQMAQLVGNENYRQDESTDLSKKGAKTYATERDESMYDNYKGGVAGKKEEKMANLDVIDNDMSDREKSSVFQYTAKNYSDINTSLRNMPLGGLADTENEANADNPDALFKSGFESANKNKFNEYKLGFTQNTVSALNKLPPYTDSKVYRHDKLFPGFAEVYREGATVTDMAFVSSTYKATSLIKLSDVVDILTIMTSKTGRFVKPLSVSQHENEVLFKPGTPFKVRKVIKGNLDATDIAGRWPNLPAEIMQVLMDDNFKDEVKYIVLRDEV